MTVPSNCFKSDKKNESAIKTKFIKLAIGLIQILAV